MGGTHELASVLVAAARNHAGGQLLLEARKRHIVDYCEKEPGKAAQNFRAEQTVEPELARPSLSPTPFLR